MAPSAFAGGGRRPCLCWGIREPKHAGESDSGCDDRGHSSRNPVSWIVSLRLVFTTESPLPRTLHIRKRHLREDLQPIRLQRNQLSRVIAQNPHRMDVQRGEYLRADAVLALLAAKGDRLIRIDALLSMGLDLREKIRLPRLAHL